MVFKLFKLRESSDKILEVPYVKQMSKKDHCAFACGPSVVVKAQVWGQMHPRQLPLHRAFKEILTQSTSLTTPHPRVRTRTAEMAVGESSVREVPPPAPCHPDHFRRWILPLPRGLLAVLGWLVTEGGTATLEECGCCYAENIAKITW